MQPPGQIHGRLEIRRRGEERADVRARVHVPKKAGVQEGVQHLGPPRQGAGEARREGHDPHHQIEQLGMRDKQRLHLNAGGQRLEEIHEAGEGRIRSARGGGGLEEARRQTGEQLALAGGAHGADAAMMPTANGARDQVALGKPHARQGR